MVRCTRVDKPYIFCFGGVGRIGGCHQVRYVPHHKHPVMTNIVGVGGVVCELSTCEHQLTLSSCDTLHRSGQTCHSICTRQSCFAGSIQHGCSPFYLMLCLARSLDLVVNRILFPRLPLIVSTFASLAPSSTALSSTFIRVHIEHMSVRCAPS